MVVIVNFFYWRQAEKMSGDTAIRHATEIATDWLLRTGHRNILIDVYNEATRRRRPGAVPAHPRARRDRTENHAQRTPPARQFEHHARQSIAWGRWQSRVDFFHHGNNAWAPELRKALREIRATDAYQAWPRPILINEDSMYLNNLEAAIDEYASWGLYIQGYGCGGWDHGRYEWPQHPRETTYEHLTGFQTVPVNWSLNTGLKRSFFYRLAEITGSPGNQTLG